MSVKRPGKERDKGEREGKKTKEDERATYQFLRLCVVCCVLVWVLVLTTEKTGCLLCQSIWSVLTFMASASASASAVCLPASIRSLSLTLSSSFSLGSVHVASSRLLLSLSLSLSLSLFIGRFVVFFPRFFFFRFLNF